MLFTWFDGATVAFVRVGFVGVCDRNIMGFGGDVVHVFGEPSNGREHDVSLLEVPYEWCAFDTYRIANSFLRVLSSPLGANA